MHIKSTPKKESEELVIIVDDENQEQMVVLRSIMRQQNLIHRSSFTAVLNDDGKILVLQRSATKDLNPNMYEITCAGVVQPFESFEECARRELQEELGIKKTSLVFIDLFFDENENNRVWGSLFKTIWNNELHFDEQEVSWGTFLTFSEIKKLIKQGKCTPESAFILEMLTQK
jgi:isopentenyldiphosphate isomerase